MGWPLYTLNAATIRQQPNEDQVQLTQVQMSFRDANGNPWTATAERGELEQAADRCTSRAMCTSRARWRDTTGDAQIFTEHAGGRPAAPMS